MILSRSLYKKLGNYLAKQRVKSGLSQIEVAKLSSGITPQFISNIERGAAAVPMHLLVKWAEIYEINHTILIKFILRNIEEQLKKDLAQ